MAQLPETLYTYATAAAYLNVSPSTLRKWVCAGVISCLKLGHGPKAPVRFTASQLNAILVTVPAIDRAS